MSSLERPWACSSLSVCLELGKVKSTDASHWSRVPGVPQMADWGIETSFPRCLPPRRLGFDSERERIPKDHV